MRALALLVGLVGCNAGSGSLELTLSLPAQADLRPTGMTTVTLTATAPGDSPVATTSVLASDRFSAGELPIGDDIQIDVVLRDVSNRIVGVGQPGRPVDIAGDRATALAIPVRRPFVYAASGSALYSFDPTLDPRDARFQGMVAGVAAPQLTVSVGGDRLAVVASGQVQVIVTATNTITGAIAIPAGARDAAAVPGTHKLAIAHATGITIVDLDAATATTVDVGPVDRVTVGPSADGTMYAYGLIGRVLPPELPPPMGVCTGTSSIVAVDVAAPVAAAAKPLGQAVSDLAAAADTATVFAALPCAGQIARLTGALDAELASVALTQVAALDGAAVLTVAGDRVWAAGTKPAQTVCADACSATTQVACPASSTNSLDHVYEGASVIVLSSPFDGANPIRLVAPDRRETIIDTEDPAGQHAQVLKALGVVPLDLVTLPGGQYVGLVTRSRYYIAELPASGFTVLPCLDATTADWLLFDMASSSIAQRVRTACDVTVGPSDIFMAWGCDEPAEGERSAFPDYQPTSIGALFGAR